MANCSCGRIRLTSSRCHRLLGCGAPGSTSVVGSGCTEQGCEWQFNPPHASHFGGVWERQIGRIRRIVDAMLLETRAQKETHELLVTLMSEVTAIVISRPITAIQSDTDEPLPLHDEIHTTLKFTTGRNFQFPVSL